MYLIDTPVIAELPKRNPSHQVVGWIETLANIVVSAITIEELAYGVAAADWDSSQRLEIWFREFLKIPPTVIPVNERIAQRAGVMRAAREKAGKAVSARDMLIAASAATTGRILVTRDIKAFAHCGIPLFSPFPVVVRK